MDINIAFLNGVVEEEVCVEKPQGFETHDIKTHGGRLNKSLYGLKQDSRMCYGRIDRFLKSFRFTKRKIDSNLYYKVVDQGPMILLLYVDDLFLTSEEKLIVNCKRKLDT